MKLTGKDGRLRIYDSSAILHGQAPLDNETVDMVKFDGRTVWVASTVYALNNIVVPTTANGHRYKCTTAGTSAATEPTWPTGSGVTVADGTVVWTEDGVIYTNITTDVEADDLLFASAFLTDLDDAVFIGSTSVFAMIQFLKDAGTNYAAGSGALKAYYFNGTDFTTVLPGVVDGTASGGDCFAQDGYIGFKIPDNWAKRGLAALDADKYYVKLMMTTSSTTDPDADVLCPVDGQYFEVAFAAMDFSGALGRAKTEETLVLDRGRSDNNAHYIEGSDDKIFEPISISFSALVDDTVNKDDIFIALDCGDPDSSRWTATGVSSKGTTKNDGTNLNPAFKDATKKTVNIQMLFEGKTANYGYAYYEVFFPLSEQTLSEAEDAVTLATTGGCYGVIERISDFGNRY